MKLDLAGISVSFGAACASGSVKNSGMLTDMGLSDAEARSSIRISFGKIHDRKDIKKFSETINKIINNKSVELFS